MKRSLSVGEIGVLSEASAPKVSRPEPADPDAAEPAAAAVVPDADVAALVGLPVWLEVSPLEQAVTTASPAAMMLPRNLFFTVHPSSRIRSAVAAVGRCLD